MMQRTQIVAMLALQDGMNSKVNLAWRDAGYPWLRAIVIEGAEAMEHHGWKWWKKQEMDREQLAIELVDIWHFALSHMITLYGDSAAAYIEENLARAPMTEMFDNGLYVFGDMTTLSKLELMIGLATRNKFSLGLFAAILGDVGMSWNDLHAGYVAKNVLNFFRQDHGYKEGTYLKVWDGKEDNVRLAELVKNMDATSSTFSADLYNELEDAYRELMRHA